MTEQQRTAFTHPCYEAEECSHGRTRVQRQTEGMRLRESGEQALGP